MTTFQEVRSGSGVLVDGAYAPPDQKNRHYRGYLTFIGGGGTPEPAPGGTLAEERTAGKARVDALARTRSAAAIAGVGAGGAETEALAAEARHAQAQIAAGVDVLEADVPLLSARIGASGETLDVASAAVVAEYDATIAAWQQIEAARVNARTAVDAAGTAAEIDGIVDTINWTQAITPADPANFAPVGGK
ncbi:MAG: hypothetical protein AAFZ87_17040 [Planctomycetota bacterium]